MHEQIFLDDDLIAKLLDLANLASHKGLPMQARDIVDGILAVKPDFVPARLALAFSHIVVNDFEPAHTILEDILAKNSKDFDARILHGLSYLLEGKRNEAEDVFSPLPADAPQKTMADELLHTL